MQGPYRAISTPRKLKSKGKTAFQTSSASSFAVTEGLESIRTDKETDLKVGLEDHGYVGRHPEGSKQTPTHNDEGWADKLPTSITPMQFLASMFPALLETTLEDALSQNNGDVERTVECLLSGQGDCSDDTSSLCSSSDFSLGEGPFRFDDSASSSTNHSSTSKSSSLMEHEFPNGCTGNDVETLSGMFPNHNRLTILSTLRTHDFDMDRAADTLSRLAIEDGSAFRQREDDHTLATLIEIFPDNDVSKLQSALRRRGGLEGAIEELTAVKNPKWKSKCEGGCLIDGYPCVIHAQARSVPTTSTRIRAQNKRSARSGASSPLLVIDGRGSSVPATPRMSPGDEDEDEELLSLPSSVGTRQIQAGDPKEFRQLAQHYREKRNDAFRRVSYYEANHIALCAIRSTYGRYAICRLRRLTAKAISLEKVLRHIIARKEER